MEFIRRDSHMSRTFHNRIITLPVKPSSPQTREGCALAVHPPTPGLEDCAEHLALGIFPQHHMSLEGSFVVSDTTLIE